MKKIFITVLVLALIFTASACSSLDEQKTKNSSLEQSSELIESKNSELTGTVETSSNSAETSSKPAVTSKETTTTSKPKPKTSSNKSSSSSKVVTTSSPSSSKPNTDTYRFTYAEEMCDDPELKAEIAQLNETFKESGLKITLEGNGNKITYVYTFLTQIDTATIKGPLEESLKAQKDTFNSQVELLQAEVKNKMVLGIKYVNADGTVICEAEFPQ